MRKGRDGGKNNGKKTGGKKNGKKKKRRMKIVATTSLPAVDRQNCGESRYARNMQLKLENVAPAWTSVEKARRCCRLA